MQRNFLLNEDFNKPFSFFKGLMSLPHFYSNTWDLIVATVIINILSLALPITLMQTYDRIIPNKAIGSLTWLVVGCFAAMIFEFATRIGRSFISGWMAARFEHQVSCSAVNKIIYANLEDIERFSLGTHMDRMNAIYTLRRYYAGQLFQVLLDLPFFLIFIYIIWFLGGFLVLIPLVLAFLLIGVNYISKIGYQISSTEQISVNERRFNFVLQALSRIHIVKTMTMEEQILRRYEFLQGETAQSAMRVSNWFMIPSNVNPLFGQLTIFGVIILGSVFVVQGTLTLGVVTACSMLGSRSIQPLQNAVSFWLRFTEAKIAKSRLQEVAEMKLESQSGLKMLPGEIEGEIELKKVHFRSRENGPFSLKNASLSIKARHMVALTGEDPFELTNFLMLLTGKIAPTEGNIFLDEFNISEWDLTNLKGKIEYIPKQGTLFKGSILDNLTLFDHFRAFSATGAARLLGIDDDVAKLPLGYQTQVSHQTTFLSSGLIQRICIARALVIRPRIILFDHTDDLMDPASSEIFKMVLDRLKGKCTIILVSDSSELNQLADRTFRLSMGKLFESYVKRAGRKAV